MFSMALLAIDEAQQGWEEGKKCLEFRSGTVELPECGAETGRHSNRLL